jgi:iron-sulfur cluster assembly protein
MIVTPAKAGVQTEVEIGTGLRRYDEEGRSMTTKTRTRPAALTLTSAAEARIAALMGRAPTGTVGVKLSTPRRGCSGLAYSVDYVAEEKPFDEKIETPGGAFYVDGASILYLIGSTMDWVEDDFTAGFTFANPNAKGACGCGESFTV